MLNSTIAHILLLLVVVIAINIVATVCVTRSDVYSRSQKALQVMLAWLLPLLGAILVISVWMSDRKAAARDPVRHDEGPWLRGIGPESENSYHGGGFGERGGDGGGSGD